MRDEKERGKYLFQPVTFQPPFPCLGLFPKIGQGSKENRRSHDRDDLKVFIRRSWSL